MNSLRRKTSTLQTLIIPVLNLYIHQLIIIWTNSKQIISSSQLLLLLILVNVLKIWKI